MQSSMIDKRYFYIAGTAIAFINAGTGFVSILDPV